MLQWGLLFQLMGFKVSLDCNKGTARATRSISRPSSHLWTTYLIPVYKEWVQIPYEIKWPSSSSVLVLGCFCLSFDLGVLKGLCWVLVGVEGTLHWGVEQKLMKGLFFFLQKHQWVKGTRDSEVPRACQWWVAMNTPKTKRETGRNCVYYWSLGRARATGEEPGPRWSWRSSTEAPEQRENRKKCPSVSLLPPSLSCPRLPLAEPDWKP